MKVSSGVFELASRTLVKKCSLPAAGLHQCGFARKTFVSYRVGLDA